MLIPSATVRANFTESSYDAFELTAIKKYTVDLDFQGNPFIPRAPHLESLNFEKPITQVTKIYSIRFHQR
jgi:hypothetical protein